MKRSVNRTLKKDAVRIHSNSSCKIKLLFRKILAEQENSKYKHARIVTHSDALVFQGVQCPVNPLCIHL